MEEKDEDLFLQSLDGNLSEEQQKILSEAENDSRFKRRTDQYIKMRNMLVRNEEDSFGPFFAERVVNRIRSMKKEIDYQLLFFFKKYQLAAIGVVVALLALNIIFSDQLTVKSVLGFEDEQTDNMVTVDLYQDLTE
jgi:hypothetical protein